MVEKDDRISALGGPSTTSEKLNALHISVLRMREQISYQKKEIDKLKKKNAELLLEKKNSTDVSSTISPKQIEDLLKYIDSCIENLEKIRDEQARDSH